jgi:hypothetical protein
VTDRFKAWLDKPYSEMSLGEIGDRDFNALAALRAVVELHRLTPEMQWGNVCGHCFKDWPCPTIKAIEKEVFGG